MSRVVTDLQAVARALAFSLVAAAVLTLVLTLVAGWPSQSAFAWSLLVVAGLAPLAVSSGVNQLMDLRIDTFTGRPRGSQAEPVAPTGLAPAGMFLFVSVPLGVLGLSIT